VLRVAAVTALALAALATPPPAAAELSPKIDPALARAFADAPDGKVEMLVVLADQADLSAAREIHGKEAKGRFVYETLKTHAVRTQAELISALERGRVPFRSFWIANFVEISADLEVAEWLAGRSDVSRIHLNLPMSFAHPTREASAFATPPPSPTFGAAWNIQLVQAPAVWALGFRGSGTVIGGQDTGYEWEHSALRETYRGWNGGTADHNYSWHDAIHSGGGVCGPDSTEPCDDFGHGTHTMGTMTGNTACSGPIGMAPEARWVGCRNMDVGNGTPATYSECFEWFVAPTDLADQNPDPSMSPHVINNSWSCPSSEGCTAPDILREVVENTRQAGIVVVVSASNSGPGCSSVSTPAAIYDASFTIGATTSTDALWPNSSRGPVTIDGSGRMKPDVSAPGHQVTSATTGGSCETLSGTSMAGPHVAGLVALLISAKPELAGEVDAIEQIIRDSAFHPANPAAQTCGGTPSNVFPNNIFGAGRIDALAAVQLALTSMPFVADFEESDLSEWSAAQP
jgi:hypothetical protein